jgi:mRNA (guanine-N7-)-methyltransferase
LTDCAGEINDRLTDAKARYKRQREKRRASRNQSADGEEAQEGSGDDVDEEEVEEARRVAKLEEEVKRMTERMEEKMRGVVDADVKVVTLMGVLQQLGRSADEGPQAKRGRGGRMNDRRARTRRRRDRDDANDMDGEDEDEDMDYESPPDGNEEDAEALPPSKALDTNLAEKTAQWEGLSLTERYESQITHRAEGS